MADTSRYRMFLQNRLVAFVVPDDRVPVVSFTGLVRGGTATDREPGAAEMMALMLATRGPCWMAPGTFTETLQDMAAEFRVQMTPEVTQVTLNVSAEDALDGLRIFSGIMRETCIDEQGLAAFRAEIAKQGQQSSARDSASVTFEGSMATAVSLFNQVLYGGHPYVRDVTEEQARDLDVGEVEGFHEDFFVPANVTLAVSGDFDLREMAQSVDQRFADWEDRGPPFLRSVPGIDAPADRRTHRFRADSSWSWLVIGHELPEIDPRDLPAVQVMNHILNGAESATRLSGERSDERGVTDQVRSHFEPNVRGPGTYTFRAATRPEAVDRVIDLVFAEITRIQSEAVTEAELRNAKAAFIDRMFRGRFENGHTTAMTLAEEWSKHLTFDYLGRYRDRLEDVSVRDVQRAAERYLDPDRMQVIVLGPERRS